MFATRPWLSLVERGGNKSDRKLDDEAQSKRFIDAARILTQFDKLDRRAAGVSPTISVQS